MFREIATVVSMFATELHRNAQCTFSSIPRLAPDLHTREATRSPVESDEIAVTSLHRCGLMYRVRDVREKAKCHFYSLYSYLSIKCYYMRIEMRASKNKR